MRIKYSIVATLFVAGIALTSCNTVNNLVSKITKKENTTQKAQQVENEKESKPVVKVNDNDKKGEMPTVDEESMKLVGGMWILRAVNGETLSAEKGDSELNRPYINFDPADSRFYANDGCNTINGDYRTLTNKGININCLLSTMMACPDAPYEQQFKSGLATAVKYTISTQDGESLLNLYNESGTCVMVLSRPETEFLNGAWQVVKIDDKNVTSSNVKIVIDIPEGKVHGNTGCNIFNGAIFMDPDKPGSVQFQQVGVTRMLCPDMETESAFLVALESVVSARERDGYAYLVDARNREVLELKPIALE